MRGQQKKSPSIVYGVRLTESDLAALDYMALEFRLDGRPEVIRKLIRDGIGKILQDEANDAT